MNGISIFSLLMAAVATAAAVAYAADPPATDEPTSVLPNLNKLSDEEKAAGWQLLFDGKTTAGWTNFHQPDISKGWQVTDGDLCRVDASAGDIVTAASTAISCWNWTTKFRPTPIAASCTASATISNGFG